MSITAETAKAHAHDPAVLCCRAEAGITIEPANLEDPAIFDDLVDSGLLNLDGCLTIEEVLGAKLTKTCDSLCPLTNDVLDGVKAPSTPVEEKAEEVEAPAAPAATDTDRERHDEDQAEEQAQLPASRAGGRSRPGDAGGHGHRGHHLDLRSGWRLCRCLLQRHDGAA